MADHPPSPSGGRFVAVGHTGQRILSLNGTEWTNAQVGKEGETYRAVFFGNGRFVAVGNYGGDNLFASTPDGVTWNTFTRKTDNSVRGLGFGNGIFLAVGGDPGAVGDSKPFVMTSTDGVTWSDAIRNKGKEIIHRVAYGNGLFVGVGDRGRRAVSRDGRDWTDAQGVKAIDTLIDVAFGKGVFVGVGLNGLRMTSRDGLVWTNRLVGEEGEHLNSILWTSDRFVAVGMGATYTSPDGTTWKRQENHDAPLVAAYGHGMFVGTHWKGRILRSADAIEWKQVFKADHHLEAITWGGS